jgi:hypothetical protein
MENTKVNITLEIDTANLSNFESWLRGQLKVIDFLIMPDTSELYKSDPVYKKLSKGVKDAKMLRDRYYNEKR